MRSPLWILNSFFLLLALIVIGFILFSLKSITQAPPRTSLRSTIPVEGLKREMARPKDTQFIYGERDLFSTYKPLIIPPKPLETLPVIPMPPRPRPLVPQPKPVIKFLEPLPIKITGIIASTNESKSQVSVVNTNTKRTETYKVGDKIFDAFLIRIFPRKIILIRSNGQQETLYLFPEDAQAEVKALQESSWNDIIRKQTETAYLVNPSTFVERISNLAAFIEMLDLTTAFKQGSSIGCRIGKMDNKSIGFALGLIPGDVITRIQGIEPSSTTNRINIYNMISDLSIGSIVKVDIIRHGIKLRHEYTLANFGQATSSSGFRKVTADAQEVKNKYYKHQEEHVESISEIQQLKMHDKFAMEHYGSKDAILKLKEHTS